jgi:hypothetical protein
MGSDAFVMRVSPDGNTIVYSIVFGGSSDDFLYGLALAADGTSVYVSGMTLSGDLPTTPGAPQPSMAGGRDGWMGRISSEGTVSLMTYLGGTADDSAGAIATNAIGEVVIVGSTYSDDFAMTPGTYRTTPTPGTATSTWADAFVLKLDPAEDLVYSTFIGAGASVAAVALDASGRVYLAGLAFSTSFPTTPGASDSTCDACGVLGNGHLTVLSADGASLLYGTFLGGSFAEFANSVALMPSGDILVGGQTLSSDFPTTAGAFQTEAMGGSDGFVLRFGALDGGAPGALVMATLVGGEGDDSLVLHQAGSMAALVTLSTTSQTLPVPFAVQETSGGGPASAWIGSLLVDGTDVLVGTYWGIGNTTPIAARIRDDGASTAVIATFITNSPDQIVMPRLVAPAGLDAVKPAAGVSQDEFLVAIFKAFGFPPFWFPPGGTP